ncbi:hypothetical protein [Rathayibacter sp. AY1B5]|jgi:hypothetical protein|uniref:hypothetical protein n=1 Tax=Rathayibacter sp. AY1B5 TaxID=2080530 RepID=UPI000CE75DAF|nr:hypothetical protein [Rathayibacter sp. AY1B5]PPI23047.1 hypothetical protein C5D44_13415 [Rathayibacter sp. AY1B5]
MNTAAEADIVRDSLRGEILESFAADVELVRLWIESANSVCVLYRRMSDGDQLIGRRIRFPPHAMNDDPASTGVDAAQDMAEPLGALVEHARPSEGVLWVGIPKADPLPSIPDTPPAPSCD